MKDFTYIITDPVGLHARPAGLFVKEVKKYKSKITVFKDEQSADALRLMAVMGLGVKCGDCVRITVEGEDETLAAAELEAYMKVNL